MKQLTLITCIGALLTTAAYAASNTNLNQQEAQKPQAPAPVKTAGPEAPVAKPVTAQPNVSEDVGDWERTLVRISTYLNSLSTIVANFTQVAPDGSISSGKFYLKRPGKMRWQYDPPTPILMVASGRVLVYYDYELEQVSHIPIDSSLASFLGREHIDLTDEDILINKIENNSGVLRITLSQTGKEEEGTLTLEFSDHPLALRNMVVTDAQRQTTTLALNNAEYGKPLDNSLFVFVDPRKKRK